MTIDEAIKQKLKILTKKRLELLSDLQTEEHDCDCEHCDFEEEVDETAKKEIDTDIADIEAEIQRFSTLKLKEKI